MSVGAQPRVTRALILAAGVGSRLRPLTDRMPKCLVPVAGRPLLEYWIDALRHAGIREAWVNTHVHCVQMRSFIEQQNSRGSGLHLQECHEPELLGSAGTISANPALADGADTILVIYADNFSMLDLRGLLASHRQRQAEFSMVLFEASNPAACGIAQLDAAGRIVEFTEKPARPRGNLANAGIYAMQAPLYAEIAARHAFDLGFDVIPSLTGRMFGYRHEGYHLDIGTPQAYAQANADAATMLVPRGQSADGRRRAVFLDRDGTLIEHVHYLNDPSQVRLVAGCTTALRRLSDAGFALVIVTNQAAIAKGLLTPAGLDLIHARLFDLLAIDDVGVDAVYYCPIAGSSDDRRVIEHVDRKPGPGMLLRASTELCLDLSRSYMVGDMLSDVLAGNNAGCRTSVLLDSDASITPERGQDSGDRFLRCRDLGAAVDYIVEDAATPATLSPCFENH